MVCSVLMYRYLRKDTLTMRTVAIDNSSESSTAAEHCTGLIGFL